MGLIKILSPGTPSFSFVKEGVDYYLKKLKTIGKVEVIFPKIKIKGSSPELRLKAEEKAFRRHLKPRDYLIVLDERGKLWRTLEFTKHLEELLLSHFSIVFLIGGPEGVSNTLKNEAKELLSLSTLTLNHEIALLLLLEALYRSFTILKGIPYHRD